MIQFRISSFKSAELYYEVRSRSVPISSRAKLSLRLLSGRSRSFRNSQRGPPCRTIRQGTEGDDYRKWPCICRNYRNNGNKTKALTHSTRIGVGRTICWIIVRFSRMILYERTSEKRKITSYSIQNEGSLFILFFFALPFLSNNALLVRWPYVPCFFRDIFKFVVPINTILYNAFNHSLMYILVIIFTHILFYLHFFINNRSINTLEKSYRINWTFGRKVYKSDTYNKTYQIF